MYVPDFRSSWAKIERAKHHRDELDSHIAEIVSDEGCHPSVGVKFKSETGDHMLYISDVPVALTERLEQCALILGDVFHNLRSALDHVVFQLALKNTDGAIKVENRVQFPIEDKVTTFDRRCIERSPGDPGAWLAEVHRDDQAIIKRFQPDGGVDGGLLLHALRNYSNGDKHRLLTPVAMPTMTIRGETDLTALAIIGVHMERARMAHETVVIPRAVLGAELFWGRLTGSTEINMDMAGHVTPEIRLDHGDRFAVPVPSIDKIVTEVELVMRKFGP
jgi:hypothetical protein